MSAPVKLTKRSDNAYTFSFSSDILSSATVSGSLYVRAFSTNSVTTDSDSIYSGNIGEDASEQIKYGFSKTFIVPSSRNYIKVEIPDLIINGGWVSDSGFEYWYEIYNPNPTITKQPTITNISPTSGLSTTIVWSAAEVANLGSSTIYYQYFVGPGSVYNDNYCIGTTTKLTATITEQNILSKCGTNFEGTCYLFVRAYWNNGSTSGGWTTPTGKAFTYTPHRTLKYYVNGGWQECIVYYYDGSGWKECFPYYYNNGWIECSG